MKKHLQLMNKPVKFKKKELFKGLIHLEFKTQKDLTSSLIRFQEHYESPKFRSKLFLFKEFHDWYKSTRKGKFTYFTDWAGFNFPSYVLKAFLQNEMGELSKREKKVLRAITGSNKFYVIGTFKSNKKLDWEVKKHEIAHALFYIDPQYRKNVKRILSTVSCVSIHRYIKKLGYHSEVFVDETHAYLLTDSDALIKAGINLDKFKEVQNKLQINFTKYLNKHMPKNKKGIL